MKNKLFLACIVLLAIFLRFNNLDSVPPSASLDEASIGYNAFSLIKTGMDEYGSRFPILLRAYDDWRPALYVYLVIPFVKFFGLNITSIRLPSVILSILTIAATYFLIKEIFSSRKDKVFLALTTSFLLAISPWHIYISRLGHEVNAGLSFAVFAILFFLKAVNGKKGLFLILSAIFFGLSLYTYQSEKVFIPLMVMILGFIYKDSLLKIKKELLTSIVLGMIIAIPIIFVSLSPEGLIRFKGTSAFSNNPPYQESAKKLLRYKKDGNVVGQFLTNRRITTLKIFINNYFSHYDYNFLFKNSGDESFKAPRIGLLYHWEFPFVILGLIFLFLKTYDRKIKIVIASWIVISFIAPSLTTGAPHAMRSYNILPIPQLLAGLGVISFFNFLLRKKIRLLFYFVSLFMVISIIYYLSSFYRQYFFTFPKVQSSSFQYALSKTIPFVLEQKNNYDKIIFSNKDNLYQSYMFFLFYSKYDPFLYQKQGGTKSGGFNETHKFGKYEFRPIVWNKDKLTKDTLFIGNADDFTGREKFLESFANLDGEEVIKIVQN